MLMNLILMDENMPKMSGVKATKMIRELENQDDITPIPKPLDNELFIRTLHKFLPCKLPQD